MGSQLCRYWIQCLIENCCFISERHLPLIRRVHNMMKNLKNSAPMGRNAHGSSYCLRVRSSREKTRCCLLHSNYRLSKQDTCATLWSHTMTLHFGRRVRCVALMGFYRRLTVLFPYVMWFALWCCIAGFFASLGAPPSSDTPLCEVVVV